MPIDVPTQAVPDAAPAQPASPDAPSELIQSILSHPIFQQVKNGQVPAVWGTPALFGDKAQAILPALQAAATQDGVGFADAPKTGAFVVYNPQDITPDEIAQADAAGNLDSIAAAISGPGSAPPADASAPPADGTDAGAPPIPPQNVAGGLLPAGAQDDLTAQRVANLTPKPPVKRAYPSQGIVNALLQRAT